MVDTSTLSDQLDRVLSFFPRIEAKIISIFGLDIGMLVILVLNFKSTDLENLAAIIFNLCALAPIVFSLYYLFIANNPELKGSSTSLAFFNDIAALDEATFVKEMKDMPEKDFKDHLSMQIWRNSELVKLKFSNLKMAFFFSIFSIPFWFVALLLATINHSKFIINQ